jgi:dihydroorotate dehydrogenase (fumarate)
MAVDVRTTYLGLDLPSPLMAAASPLTGEIASLQALEGAGVGAVVLRSLFEEQIQHDEIAAQDLFLQGAEISPEITGFFPELEGYNTGPDAYLGLIQQAKRALSIPVIASLNGHTKGGWTRYASLFEDAGADAIELNVYFLATDPAVTSAEVEDRYVDLVGSVVSQVKVPVSVKIGPFFSSLPNFVLRVIDAGAKGMVLFNRFVQPDVFLEDLTVRPRLVLSESEEARLALRWIAILRGYTDASLAANSGVHNASDAMKLLLAGADAVQIASSFIKRGPYIAETVLRDMVSWMDEHEYESVAQLRGSLSQRNVPDPEAFERANYMKALVTFTSEQA